MYIHTSTIGLFAHRQWTMASKTMSKAIQRLSSGYRINSAADGAADLAISERMRAQLTSLRREIRNAKDGQSMAGVAEGALGESHRMLNRLVNLASAAASGTMDAGQRQALQQEANQILDEIKRTSSTTKYSDLYLLNGGLTQEQLQTTTLQVGNTGNNYDRIDIQMPNLNSVASLLKDFDVTTQEAAATSLKNAYAAIERNSELRAGLGATSNRMDYSVRAMEAAEEALTEAESRFRDADMAKEMMNYARALVVAQGAQIAMVYASKEPERALDLMKESMGMQDADPK